MQDQTTFISSDAAEETEARRPRRILFIGLGRTGALCILERLWDGVRANLKRFELFDSDVDSVKAVKANPRLLSMGRAHHLPIPAWLGTRRPSPDRVDEYAELRPLVFGDRPYFSDPRGTHARREGYMVFAAAYSQVETLLREAIEVVGRQEPGERHAVVHVVITAFSGRGTGSGGLLLILAAIERIRQETGLDVRVIPALQCPTVRVSDFKEYVRRSATLLLEVTAAWERGVEAAPGREFGGDHRLVWDQFLIFGDTPEAGIDPDVDRRRRHWAWVLKTRLDSAIADKIESHMPRRKPRLLGQRGFESLPTLFSAMGAAELRYEPEAAARLGAKLLWLRLLQRLSSSND